MSRYDRFALIFDPDGDGLGLEALGLIERGIDPLYAKDLDDAVQLAEQEEERVGALLLPGSLSLEQVDAALERIAPFLWAGAGAVVLVAPPRERALLRTLRDRGIRWVLYDPYEPAELRFAAAAALAAEDDLDPRSGMRVPIRLDATIESGGVRREAKIRNLSMGGAYLALSDPPVEGARIALEFGLGERALRAAGVVVHRLAAPQPGRAEREPGVGLAFGPLGETEQRLLRDFIRERVDSFRL